MEFKENIVPEEKLISLNFSSYEIAVLLCEAEKMLIALNDRVIESFESTIEAIDYIKKASQDSYNLAKIVNKLYGRLSCTGVLADNEILFSTYEIELCKNILYQYLLDMNIHSDLNDEDYIDSFNYNKIDIYSGAIAYLYNSFKTKYILHCSDNIPLENLNIKELDFSKHLNNISNNYVLTYKATPFSQLNMDNKLKLSSNFFNVIKEIENLTLLVESRYSSVDCIFSTKKYIMNEIAGLGK